MNTPKNSIIPIIIISLLLVTLTTWCIYDSFRQNKGNTIIGTHYLVNQYIKKCFLQITMKLLANESTRTENVKIIKNDTVINNIYSQNLQKFSSIFSIKLHQFVRGDEVLNDIYTNIQEKKMDFYLFPDTFIEKYGKNYYSILLSSASIASFSQDLYSNFSNQEAKQFLQKL